DGQRKSLEWTYTGPVHDKKGENLGLGVRLPVFTLTADGGVLDELRQIVEQLSRRTGGTRAARTRFVLTGWGPDIPKATCELILKSYGRLDTSRIVLEADPATSPSAVASLFRSQRVRWLRHSGTHRRRRATRPLAELVALIDALP